MGAIITIIVLVAVVIAAAIVCNRSIDERLVTAATIAGWALGIVAFVIFVLSLVYKGPPANAKVVKTDQRSIVAVRRDDGKNHYLYIPDDNGNTLYVVKFDDNNKNSVKNFTGDDTITIHYKSETGYVIARYIKWGDSYWHTGGDAVTYNIYVPDKDAFDQSAYNAKVEANKVPDLW
ncbi:hypothetical protein FWF48_03585 [Candidatus Saccharibacteria bacterium]|nr:hypothetical protein [Candidatus Saccharibacteria bacterium]